MGDRHTYLTLGGLVVVAVVVLWAAIEVVGLRSELHRLVAPQSRRWLVSGNLNQDVQMKSTKKITITWTDGTSTTYYSTSEGAIELPSTGNWWTVTLQNELDGAEYTTVINMSQIRVLQVENL